MVNFFDRTNMGFAALQMNQRLGLTPSVFGFGVSIFFAGYIVCIMPAAFVIRRVGARRWIAAIAYLVGTRLGSDDIRIRTTLVVCRPSSSRLRRGRISARYSVLLNPLVPGAISRGCTRHVFVRVIDSGYDQLTNLRLATLVRRLGLAGWQWMFLVEAMPAVILGLIALRWLTDRPENATWLGADQREWLLGALRRNELRKQDEAGASTNWLLDSRVWLLGLSYFFIGMSVWVVFFWLPQVLKAMLGASNFQVGLIAIVPYFIAVVVTIWCGWNSDRTGDRRWHVTCALLVGGAGLIVAGIATSPLIAFAGVCVGMFGVNGSIGVFWAMVSELIQGYGTAPAIGWISAWGALGGLISPDALRPSSATNRLVLDCPHALRRLLHCGRATRVYNPSPEITNRARGVR